MVGSRILGVSCLMIAFVTVLAGCEHNYYYEDDIYGRGRPDYGYAYNSDPNIGIWNATPPMPQGHMAASYPDQGGWGRSGGYGYMPSPGDLGGYYSYYNRSRWNGGSIGDSHYDPCIGDENADMWGGAYGAYKMCRQSRWAPRRNPYYSSYSPCSQPNMNGGYMMPQQSCNPGMWQRPQPMMQQNTMWQPQPLAYQQNQSQMPMAGAVQAEYPGFSGQQQGVSQNSSGSNVQVTTGGGFAGGGDWIANEGDSLRALLQEWGEKAGWRVVWSSDREYTLEAGAVFRGEFVDVTSALIRAFARATPAPQGTFYRGNRVLVINTQESENAD